MTWKPVPLRDTLEQWAGATIAAGGLGNLGQPTTALLRVGTPDSAGNVRVVFLDMAHEAKELAAHVALPAGLTISEAVLALTFVRPDRASVPPKVVGLKLWPTKLAAGVVVLGFILAVALSVNLGEHWPALAYVIFAPAALFGAWMMFYARRTTSPARVLDGANEIGADEIYAHLTVDDTAADPTRLSPRSRVDLVKERYGALQADIVYRIENSALFDSAVPATQRFELALISWDEASPQATELATEVEAAFDDARRHAEEVGLDHLPESARDTGRRAARAAHTALHGATDGEREAARERVADMLGSLALYYLPPVDPAAPMLVGERKQIEPR